VFFNIIKQNIAYLIVQSIKSKI